MERIVLPEVEGADLMVPTIHGYCRDDFSPLKEAFASSFTEHGERGAAVAVYLGKEPVVDLWGGLADPTENRPWKHDTIAHAYSVSKPFVAACALLLVDRGLLDLDAPVTRYWPEYGQAGKEGTLVRHLLTHEAGLVLLREPRPAQMWLDWQQVTEALASEPPLWPPGEANGEHAAFFGHLVGEVIRRVDGRTPGRFLREELADPWQLDFHIGLEESESARAVRLVDEGGHWRQSILADPRPLLASALTNPPGLLDADFVNSPAYRAAEVPAVNGHGSARAIARFYAGLAAGGIMDGMRLFKEETIEEMIRLQTRGRDVVIKTDDGWGLGVRTEPAEGFFGLGGIGGFSGFALRRCRLAVSYGYVTSWLGGHERSEVCEEALEGVLEALQCS